MKNKYIAVMILCFIFGGYFILTYISQVYFAYGAEQVAERNGRDFNISGSPDALNRTLPARGDPQFNRIFSSNQLINLLSGIMFIVAGISVARLSREREMKVIKEEITDIFLLPEEKEVMELLRRSAEGATQNELVRKTGLSKVKVHRILSKLETRGIVKRHPYGLTKKVVLAKKVHG